jgi:hypothetical protein
MKLTRSRPISFSWSLGLHTEFDHWPIGSGRDWRVAAATTAFPFGVFGKESRAKSNARNHEQQTSKCDDD